MRVALQFGLGLVLGAGGLLGCNEQSPTLPPVVRNFDQNQEAVRFVRGIREGLENRRRPAGADVQRLKSIANQYPNEAFIGDVLLALLPGLKDWDGLTDYYEHKAELSDHDRAMSARVYIQQANYGAARDVIRVVADAQPENVEANALLGRSLYFFGEYDEATMYYDRVWTSIVADKRVGDITYRAMIYYDQGNSDRALEILRAAIADSPGSIGIHNALGRVLAASGQDAEARVHRDRATELQDELSKHETDQMLRAARVFALNRALQNGDAGECQRMIFEYLPDSDPAFQQELFSFLESVLQRAGRSAEVPAALERARELVRKGN